MNAIEALATVELVEVNWPRTALGDDTKQMWAAAIAKAEPNASPSDGYEAIRDLAMHQTFAPSLAEVLVGIYGARASRQGRRPALLAPSSGTIGFAQFLRENPEMAERVKALKVDRDHRESPIPAGLSELLKMDGLAARKGWRG